MSPLWGLVVTRTMREYDYFIFGISKKFGITTGEARERFPRLRRIEKALGYNVYPRIIAYADWRQSQDAENLVDKLQAYDFHVTDIDNVEVVSVA